jgi:hypothetical protein
MNRYTAALRGLGVIALLSLGISTAGRAQADTTRRVRVTKERPVQTPTASVPVRKEISPPPDTTSRVSTGSVSLPRDTVPVVTTPPLAPTQAQPRQQLTGRVDLRSPRSLFGRSGFFIGLGGALAVPYNQFSDLGYQTSYGMAIPMGWHRIDNTVGVRALLGYDQAHAHVSNEPGGLPAERGSGPDPKIYTASLDAVLRFPLTQSFREGRGLAMYAMGGGGVYLFRGFGGTDPLRSVLGIDEVGDSKKNIHKWGLNVGAGLEWALGPTALFVESRFVNVFTTDSRSGNDNLRWIPVAAGVIIR